MNFKETIVLKIIKILWVGFTLLFLALCSTVYGQSILNKEEPSGICPQPRKTPKAPDEYLKAKNPLEPTSKNILAGKTLFMFDAKPSACKICHGLSGDGLGIMFRQVHPKPRNFTCVYTMDKLPDGQLFWVIKNGSPGTAMPSFDYLDDNEIWQLVLYLRSFAKKDWNL